VPPHHPRVLPQTQTTAGRAQLSRAPHKQHPAAVELLPTASQVRTPPAAAACCSLQTATSAAAASSRSTSTPAPSARPLHAACSRAVQASQAYPSRQGAHHRLQAVQASPIHAPCVDHPPYPPLQGVAVAASHYDGRLHIIALADGTPVSSVPCSNPSFVAAAAEAAAATAVAASAPRSTQDLLNSTAAGCSSTVFASSWSDGSFGVSAWRCEGEGAGARLSPLGPISAIESTQRDRPLAVCPPVPGTGLPPDWHASHLVVGACGSNVLSVFSLPGLRLIHTEYLRGMRVTGVAADPVGAALAVSDFAARAVHVIPWPPRGIDEDSDEGAR
jgi:hypothetical protein